MLTRDIACITPPLETIASRRAERQRDCRAVHGEAKFVPIEFDLSGDIDIVLATRGDEPTALGAKVLRGPREVRRERMSNRVSSAFAFVSMGLRSSTCWIPSGKPTELHSRRVALPGCGSDRRS
jgi:hypothetical protein